jgi:hypothetical protein
MEGGRDGVGEWWGGALIAAEYAPNAFGDGLVFWVGVVRYEGGFQEVGSVGEEGVGEDGWGGA